MYLRRCRPTKVGTPKGQLKRFEQELLKRDWRQVREGLGVKRCPSPDGKESFILCRSAARAVKEKQIHERFESRRVGMRRG